MILDPQVEKQLFSPFQYSSYLISCLNLLSYFSYSTIIHAQMLIFVSSYLAVAWLRFSSTSFWHQINIPNLDILLCMIYLFSIVHFTTRQETTSNSRYHISKCTFHRTQYPLIISPSCLSCFIHVVLNTRITLL